MPIKYSVLIVSEPDMGLLCEALFEALFPMCNAVKYAGLREECYLPPISPQPEHGHNTSIKHCPLQLLSLPTEHKVSIWKGMRGKRQS